MSIDTPLTDAELDRLSTFLADEYSPPACMDTSMLDGYLAAVASGPNLVMPDQMLRWIWDTEAGEDSPEFRHNKEASEIIGLIPFFACAKYCVPSFVFLRVTSALQHVIFKTRSLRFRARRSSQPSASKSKSMERSP